MTFEERFNVKSHNCPICDADLTWCTNFITFKNKPFCMECCMELANTLFKDKQVVLKKVINKTKK